MHIVLAVTAQECIVANRMPSVSSTFFCVYLCVIVFDFPYSVTGCFHHRHIKSCWHSSLVFDIVQWTTHVCFAVFIRHIMASEHNKHNIFNFLYLSINRLMLQLCYSAVI